MEGFIALHKRIKNWEWYTDGNTMRLFIHCLLTANYKQNSWRGHTIERGQFIASIEGLSKDLGLSTKQIRTAIAKLKRTSELASEGRTQHTVFTVINYNLYQSEGKQDGKQEASEGQTKGKRGATTNKNNKNNNNNNTDSDAHDSNDSVDAAAPAKTKRARARTYCDKLKFADGFDLAAKLFLEKNNRTDISALAEFEKFIDYHQSRATQSANWRSSWSSWLRNAIEFKQQPQPQPTQPGAAHAANKSGFRVSNVEQATRQNFNYAEQLKRELLQQQQQQQQPGQCFELGA